MATQHLTPQMQAVLDKMQHGWELGADFLYTCGGGGASKFNEVLSSF
jgi:hypothetical protein